MSSLHNVTEPIRGESRFANRAAPGVPYFTPLQDPVAGTAFLTEDGKPVPKLFQPLKIRGLVLQNRIMLSPLCQYSADDGHMTEWHMAHLGGIFTRGPGLSCIEAAAVTPEGRITPQDVGIWKDSQIEPIKRIVEFAKSQGQHMMIQLAHAGRKASNVAPWLSSGAVAEKDIGGFSKGSVAGKELGGWPDNVLAPSAIPWDDNHVMPKAMTLEDIENFKKAFKAAVIRSLACGFSAIEIHSAHGYLLHSFLSPVSNQRSDKYGGSFENRIRLLVEISELVRAEIPDDMPLFVRVSATDWLEESEEIKDSWTSDQTDKLAQVLAEKGVDLLDVSTGGSHPAQHPHVGPSYQAPFALSAKKAVGEKMAVGTVGAITSGKQANELLEKGLDLVIIGRMFQKNPGLVFTFADELGVQVQMPNQIRWGFGGRGKKAGKAVTQELKDGEL